MKLLIDLIIIDLSAAFVFGVREWWGHFPNQAPSFFMHKYLLTLMLLNGLYSILFWILGAYDKRQKRALIEEFVLIFGVISTGLFVLITILFLGKMWWMSRGILYMFWGLSIFLLCLFRTIGNGRPSKSAVIKAVMPPPASVPEIKESLSIIIVSTNEKQKLANCLESISKAGLNMPLEIIVVDNNSSDGTGDFIKNNHPKALIVRNPVKMGYPKSVNNGLQTASNEFCLILNPDIVVLPSSIEFMMEHMKNNPKVGIAGSKLLNEDGTLQYSARRFLDLRTYLYRFTPFRGLMAGSALERYYLMQDWDHKDNRLVDWVLGGCMLVRRKAIEEVGTMDENIFMYFDDVDWCYRMWDAGWQVAYIADSVMTHKHIRTSANKIFNKATAEHIKSLFYFIRKHGLKISKNAPSAKE